MPNKVECGIYTMCLVQDRNKVLLLNRPDRLGFPGYLGPGGKVDLPESVSEGAIRELRTRYVRDLDGVGRG